MLHAAWSRLSEAEKQRLGQLLEHAYANIKDSKLEERMAYYDRAQPGSRSNELHSILGTEHADLGSELETHYARFFSDRSRVVALHAKYNQRFVDLERQVTTLQAKLKQQRAVIEQRKESYDTSMTVLNDKIRDFNQRATSGGFGSQQQFQAERSQLQAEGQRLSSQKAALLQQIDQYNADVEKLNALGEQADRLSQSLDSQKAVE